MDSNKQVKIIKALFKFGFNSAEKVTIYNFNGTGKDIPAIMVEHNYNGLYPDIIALSLHDAARRIAEKNGCTAEKRGCCTATLIY